MRGRRVVILGGGFCGSILAKKLDQLDAFETILIDENGWFEFYPSLPKVLTDIDLKSNIRVGLDSFLSDTEVIEEEVEEVNPEYVKTSQNKVDFDYLVICLGADYPIRLENKEDVFTLNNIANSTMLSRRVHESESVLIIGGGLIGVEAASELADNTEKELTLVHPHDRLIDRNPEGASRYAEKFLEKRGVRLIFDDKVVENEEYFHTQNEKTIQADTAIWCGGLGFDKSIFHGFDDLIFSEKGGLEVDEHLRLNGHDRIFVGGDITSVEEEKTGHNADRHAGMIYRNILKHSKDKKLSSYGKREFPLVISLGRMDGIFTYRSVSISGPLPALLKYVLEKAGIMRLRL